MHKQQHTNYLSRFSRSESGSMTVFGLFIFVVVALVGAVALDVSYLYSKRTQIQLAADQVAHGALYQRNSSPEPEAKASGLALAEGLLPFDQHGSIITESDIEFGTFDFASATFTPNSLSRDAVLVTASAKESKGNAASSFLFRLAGVKSFDIQRTSVWMTYKPECLNQGFIAEDLVDLQSNNQIGAGFCVHSNHELEFGNHNNFSLGSRVSLPNTNNVQTSASGQNPGLDEALTPGFMNLRVLDRLGDFRTGLLTGDPNYLPGYINDSIPMSMKGKKFKSSDFIPGKIYHLECQGGKLRIDADTTPLSNVVIVTACEIGFSSSSSIEDAVVLTTSTSATSINAPSGIQVGKIDNCAAGGDASLITFGGMKFSSDLGASGAQFIARGDINFSANANAINGISMISGDTISGTSNMNVGLCDENVGDQFQIDYFRMAR